MKTAVPVTIIGGYLGAGKTTLINRLLTADHGQRITVLVNDFGEINIDASLIARHSGDTISLTNGCVCCTVAGDLASTLRDASRVDPSPDHIVVEASGVADPARVSHAARGWSSMRLHRTITLFDPQTVRKRINDKYVGTTVRRQLTRAQLLWPTRRDIISASDLLAIKDWLAQIAPDVPMADNARGELSDLVSLVLDKPRQEPSSVSMPIGSAAGISPQFETSTWRPSGAVAREQLLSVFEKFGKQLARCKGWLYLTESPDRATLVQHDQSNTEFVSTLEMPTRTPALVFIYPKGSIDESDLFEALS